MKSASNSASPRFSLISQNASEPTKPPSIAYVNGLIRAPNSPRVSKPFSSSDSDFMNRVDCDPKIALADPYTTPRQLRRNAAFSRSTASLSPPRGEPAAPPARASAARTVSSSLAASFRRTTSSTTDAHKDFSDVYGEMSGKGASASGAHRKRRRFH